LYLACREAKFDIVRLFLQLNVNQYTKIYISETEAEDCLGVASRWNFLRIVELLLRKGNYNKKDISIALKKTDSQEVKSVLKNYIKNKKSKSLCCF
jgi:hypothetical protein